MQRVAVFGNAGGGKSTLACRLAALTGLPLHVVDMMEFRPGGARVPQDEFLAAHAQLLRRERWIIDGFGGAGPAWERFARADTLIHVDLALPWHYLGVTHRLLKGLFVTPAGWPEGSPMWRSSLSSYRVIPLCHRHLTPRYRQLLAEQAGAKRVHALRSPGQMREFLAAVARETVTRGG
ncbi:hypothetical protein [Roseateles violae]|uniref:Adenylate kinase family enzyme n=1 Tax=Roseateles violae TaxID=3058042 RepID=A0ABT8DXW2_9BURK|nr:hypothetical protein [Pelomonas sp. PFR6]MDN3922485.1 hypothetical protein [Pelomonas sp. PFR6]